MINKITPNFLPCGIPPFGDFHSEMVFPIRNAWVLFLKNAFIEFSTFVVIRANRIRLCSSYQIKYAASLLPSLRHVTMLTRQ